MKWLALDPFSWFRGCVCFGIFMLIDTRYLYVRPFGQRPSILNYSNEEGEFSAREWLASDRKAFPHTVFFVNQLKHYYGPSLTIDVFPLLTMNRKDKKIKPHDGKLIY